MSMNDNDSEITGAQEPTIFGGGVIRGQVGPAGGGEHQPGATDGAGKVDEPRDEAADHDDDPETEADDDRTQH